VLRVNIMIKLENKPYKTLILQIPKSNISFTNLTIDPHTSKLEVIKGSKYTYLNVALKASYPSYWHNLVEKELQIDLKEAILLSKGSWMKAVNSVYYGENEGRWLEESFITWGKKPIKYSASGIVGEKKVSEGQVIKEIIDIFANKEAMMEWRNDKDKMNVIDTLIPDTLYGRQSNIQKQEAKKRMCIVINGESETGKHY